MLCACGGDGGRRERNGGVNCWLARVWCPERVGLDLPPGSCRDASSFFLPDMLLTVSNYIRERRDGLQRKAYVTGGAYLAWKHIAGRMKELRDVQIIQRFAEDRCATHM